MLHVLAAAIALMLTGCVIPGDGWHQPMRISGRLVSESGAPVQQRLAVARTGRNKATQACGPRMFDAPECRDIIVTPDAAGNFNAQIPGGRCAVFLWLVPPLGLHGCGDSDYIAVSVETSPPSAHLLQLDDRDRARLITSGRGAPEPGASSITVNRFQWRVSGEKPDALHDPAELDLRIVLKP
jgi:hypothetical protein